jgi:predicted urease superfamily metal-dependent hydrolase
MPDNETINKHIHEKVFGWCWGYPPEGVWKLPVEERLCVKCGIHLAEHKPVNNSYTSDESPRRLLNEAVDKAVEMVGEETFGYALGKVLGGQLYHTGLGMGKLYLEFVTEIARAAPQQIATAIYHATKEEGK